MDKERLKVTELTEKDLKQVRGGIDDGKADCWFYYNDIKCPGICRNPDAKAGLDPNTHCNYLASLIDD